MIKGYPKLTVIHADGTEDVVSTQNSMLRSGYNYLLNNLGTSATFGSGLIKVGSNATANTVATTGILTPIRPKNQNYDLFNVVTTAAIPTTEDLVAGTLTGGLKITAVFEIGAIQGTVREVGLDVTGVNYLSTVTYRAVLPKELVVGATDVLKVEYSLITTVRKPDAFTLNVDDGGVIKPYVFEYQWDYSSSNFSSALPAFPGKSLTVHQNHYDEYFPLVTQIGSGEWDVLGSSEVVIAGSTATGLGTATWNIPLARGNLNKGSIATILPGGSSPFRLKVTPPIPKDATFGVGLNLTYDYRHLDAFATPVVTPPPYVIGTWSYGDDSTVHANSSILKNTVPHYSNGGTLEAFVHLSSGDGISEVYSKVPSNYSKLWEADVLDNTDSYWEIDFGVSTFKRGVDCVPSTNTILTLGTVNGLLRFKLMEDTGWYGWAPETTYGAGDFNIALGYDLSNENPTGNLKSHMFILPSWDVYDLVGPALEMIVGMRKGGWMTFKLEHSYKDASEPPLVIEWIMKFKKKYLGWPWPKANDPEQYFAGYLYPYDEVFYQKATPLHISMGGGLYDKTTKVFSSYPTGSENQIFDFNVKGGPSNTDSVLFFGFGWYEKGKPLENLVDMVDIILEFEVGGVKKRGYIDRYSPTNHSLYIKGETVYGSGDWNITLQTDGKEVGYEPFQARVLGKTSAVKFGLSRYIIGSWFSSGFTSWAGEPNAIGTVNITITATVKATGAVTTLAKTVKWF